jgi:hypothetical protein
VSWFGDEVDTVGTQGPTAKYSTNGEPRPTKGSVGFEGLKGVRGAGRVETAGRYSARAKVLVQANEEDKTRRDARLSGRGLARGHFRDGRGVVHRRGFLSQYHI